MLLEPQKLKGRLRPNNFCSAGPCDLHTNKYALTSNLEASHKLVVIFPCLVVTKVHSIKTLYQPLPTEFSDHYIIKQSSCSTRSYTATCTLLFSHASKIQIFFFEIPLPSLDNAQLLCSSVHHNFLMTFCFVLNPSLLSFIYFLFVLFSSNQPQSGFAPFFASKLLLIRSPQISI